MRKFLVFTAFVFTACSNVGLLPSGSSTSGVASIPRIILNCQTSQCRTNATAPLISAVITTSPCTDPLFGAVVSTSTRSTNCTSTAGCYVETSSWVTPAGATTATVSPGTYNVCGCINYSGTGNPWATCNSSGKLNNVTIGSSTGLTYVNTWSDN